MTSKCHPNAMCSSEYLPTGSFGNHAFLLSEPLNPKRPFSGCCPNLMGCLEIKK